MHPLLLDHLEWVARRFRWLYAWKAVATTSLVFAVVGLGLLGLAHAAAWGGPSMATWLGLLAAATLAARVGWAFRSAKDLTWVARQVEARYPGLQAMLLAAVEQRPRLPDGRFGYLQARVIRGALDHAERHNWLETVPTRHLRRLRWAGAAALALLAAVVGGLAAYAREHRATLHFPFLSGSAWDDVAFQVTVAPGDVEIERGTGLVVTARFAGRLPDQAWLVCEGASTGPVRTAMSRSLSDPVFGTRLAEIQADLKYRVEFADQTTRTYQVTVYELPELRRADAVLQFPDYTGMEPKRIEDTRRVTAVEGTSVTLICHLNKAVDRAELVAEDGTRITLTPARDDPCQYEMTHVLRTSARYTLHLVDAAGRKNRVPPELVFRATPNRPADVKMVFPARDVRVSPIEELETAASVWDDFGLRAYGVTFHMAGLEEQEVVLGEDGPRNERRQVGHLIDFESLGAEPDQLLAYYYWAEDVGPDEQPRRTRGDLYFAEIRHFEEIYRQGSGDPSQQQRQHQQQQQSQSGNARQAEQLAELQKQIINATWTIIRRQSGPRPSDSFEPDVTSVLQSQQELLTQLSELAPRVEDPQSQQHVADVEQHMREAVDQLAEAILSRSPRPLDEALRAEQAAYQALLRLRAREHRVVRGRQPQARQAASSTSGPQSRAQQQLDQLELKNSENRYETERQAQAQQELAQRETLQVLNRLRELARRQDDLNRRLQELQSALERAQTEQQREEIQRQLKRLRDQQEEILRDMDELDQRMGRPENQERMAQARQQLDQTRRHVRNAGQAIQQGRVSQAVASGTRAQQQLEEMRETFRQEAAGQFSDRMRQLRDDARQLDENQTELAQQLQELDRPSQPPDDPGREPRSLRDPTNPSDLADRFRQQREELDQLLEEIAETVEEAEEAEPLLARQLYDSLRRTRQERVDDALDVTRRMLDQGLLQPAREVESIASNGIRQLRNDVEEAAENILGDEEQALRRAHQTLTELADELNQELAQANRQPGEAAGRQPLPDRDEPNQPRPAAQDGTADRAPAQRRSGQQPGETAPPDEPRTEPGPRLRDGDPRPEGGRRERSLADTVPRGPFTGGDFLRWSDRLREVEEMIDDRQMRSEAARIRQRARAIRRDLLRRWFEAPQWDLVRRLVAEPLAELRDQVGQALLRRRGDQLAVPIDRDPVPPRYADPVRRYYEQLGQGDAPHPDQPPSPEAPATNSTGKNS